MQFPLAEISRNLATFSNLVDSQCACTRARKGGFLGPWRLSPLQRGYGAPPGPDQPTRSRLGAARGFPRPLSRVAEIGMRVPHMRRGHSAAARPLRGPRPPPSVLHTHAPHCGTRHRHWWRWRARAAAAAARPATAAAASAALGSGGATSLALTCTPAGRGNQVHVRQENHGPKVGAVHGQSRSR
jgi:hypothetical protein